MSSDYRDDVYIKNAKALVEAQRAQRDETDALKARVIRLEKQILEAGIQLTQLRAIVMSQIGTGPTG